MRQLINPYYIYILSFLFVIILNSLKWSDYLLDLSIGLILFFAITFFIAFFCGIRLQKLRKYKYVASRKYSKSDNKRVMFIILGYIIEFLYSRQIPLLQFGFGVSDDGFVHFGGIPTFHVIIVTYTVYYVCVYFYKLISYYSLNRLLVFLAIMLIPPLLMLNRGMLFTEIITCIFIYLLSIKKFNKKYMIYIIVVTIFSLTLFAYLGAMKVEDDYENSVITSYVQPTKKFESTKIPSIFLWPYIYASSPISNLQLCISKYSPMYSEIGFLKTLCPDFISSRLFDEKSSDKKKEPPLISPVFNVCTMYYGSYVSYGWIGMSIMFCINILIISISLLSTSANKNENYTVLYALICTIMTLNTFSNMWTFSAISFPIAWVYIDKYLKRFRWFR